MKPVFATPRLASFTLGLGCAALWCVSFGPALKLWPALPLLMSPLAGMICDAPQTPCLRVLGGYYAILSAVPIELGVMLLFLLSAFRTSWRAALASNVLNWSLYAIVLPPDWRS